MLLHSNADLPAIPPLISKYKRSEPQQTSEYSVRNKICGTSVYFKRKISYPALTESVPWQL